MKTRAVAGLATLVTSAALFVGSTVPVAHASLLGACAGALVTSPPTGIANGVDESDAHVAVFAEKGNLSLPSALGVDITPPASFPTLYGSAASQKRLQADPARHHTPPGIRAPIRPDEIFERFRARREARRGEVTDHAARPLDIGATG